MRPFFVYCIPCLGNVSQELVASAHVARTFIKLNLDWISSRLGKVVVRDPATANVMVHLRTAGEAKEGISLGAVFTGESTSERGLPCTSLPC